MKEYGCDVLDALFDNCTGSKASIFDRYHIMPGEVEVHEIVEAICEWMDVEYYVVLDVVLREHDFQDRAYLCEGNYLDWVSEEISYETGLDKGFVYEILEAESDFFFEGGY